MAQYKVVIYTTDGDEETEYWKNKNDLIGFLADIASRRDIEYLDITKGKEVIY